MNQEHRQKVLDYLSKRDTSPLIFKGYESPNEEFDINSHSIKSMILRTLELMKGYRSDTADSKEFECIAGANRSILDIWRHIKFYYPSVEIFDVMQAMYDIYETENVYGFYCTDINRRVFKFGTNYHISRIDNQREMFRYCYKMSDEFGLVWDDWKEI